VAEAQAAPGERQGADGEAAAGKFDRDTAVRELRREDAREAPARVELAAEVSPDWRAGRGPHGGYIAAMLMRALIESVADPHRAPRSLTIHYARAPQPGPVSILATIERAGRSLSTLSARMEQQGKLIALALSAFSVPWSAPQILELPMPEVAPPDPPGRERPPLFQGAPPFTRQISIQPRIGAVPFTGSEHPMEIGSWLGLAEPRAIDAISLAFFADALFSPPFIRLTDPATTPTVDLTVHFRTALPPADMAAPGGLDGDIRHELPLCEPCFARFRSGLVQDGFFEEDGVIWAADGTVLAQSRQLGIVMALPPQARS
jgi:acyl-coenzyme A thioesterase PaaI-like protein